MIKTLEKVFAEMDVEFEANQIEWAFGRMSAIREFRASEEANKLGYSEYYHRLWNIAGGKTWYNVFNGRNQEMVRELVIKNCKAIADKRNATIANKLAKAGVTEIGDIEFHRTTDGFNGVFLFENTRVEIRTILAGGYNIQCLHQRTLVYVNERRV